MKRALLPMLLLGSLVLNAFNGVSTGSSDKSSNPVPAVTQPAVQPLKEEPPKQEDPQPEPPKQEAGPAVKWYSPGIGLPLRSDDPAAQGKKVAMLTFDDGPHPVHTDKILDTLREQNVKALFFITGYGTKNKEALVRIHKEGHVIGVHSMTHANLPKLSEAEMRKELEPLIKIIEDVTGQKPKYMRPPFGAYNDKLRALLKEYGLELINWTNGSLDWAGVDANGYKDPNKIVEDVVQQLHPGANILMHDTHRHTAEALPQVIKQIRAQGYEFVVLP